MIHGEKSLGDVLSAMTDQELIDLLQRTGGPIVMELSRRGIVDVRVCRGAINRGETELALKAVLTDRRAA